MTFHIEQLQPDEVASVVEFILPIFDCCVAPWIFEEGAEEFRMYTNRKAIRERQKADAVFFTAKSAGALVGVAEIRQYQHLGLLFVDTDIQQRGIGRALVNKVAEECRVHAGEVGFITVNSSPNAVGFYQRVGFVAQDEEQIMNGIRFTPMRMMLKDVAADNR